MGRNCLNGGYARIESLEFPVEAFKDFLRAERMPLPDFWQTKTGSTGGHIKPAPAVCPVTAVPSLPNECREVEPLKTAPAVAPSVASGIEGAGVDLSEAIAFGRSTRRILELIQDWLNRSPERKGPESQWRESLCRYLDHVARSEGWGKSTTDGGLSGAQWEGIQLIFLPAPIGLGGGSESWGGSCSLKNVKPKDRDKDKTKKSHK